jgi:polyisoprenoid-binding protein YceI
MKKVIAILAVALISAASVFAFSVGDVKGTWKDEKWDANWTFSADENGLGSIVLTKASTGEVVYTFTDANTSNFKITTGTNGVTISFTCKDTYRSYKFTKGISLSTDLDYVVDPDWSTTDYTATLKFQK